MFDETSTITSIVHGDEATPKHAVEKYKNESHNFPPYLLQLHKYSFLEELASLKDVDMIFSAPDGPYRDELAFDIAEGVINLINLSIQQNADVIFFTDKSARPAAHLFRKTWKLCFPDRDMPEVRFVNIGKEGGEKYENSSALNELRNAHHHRVAGGKIIIADEFVATGKTLVKAKRILESVFPKAREIIVTGLFINIPTAYESKLGIGVMDKNLPESNSFVSTTRAGFIRSGVYEGESEETNARYKRLSSQEDINRMRKQLADLAKCISDNQFVVPLDSFVVLPRIPDNESIHPNLIKLRDEQAARITAKEILK